MIKNTIIETIDNYENELIDLTKKIWDNPEIAYNEKFASNLQREYLQSKGFIIKPVEGLETAFIAEYEQGEPVVGFMGEYDALSGLSQKVSSEKSPVNEGAAGHACGHNLLGVGSLGAALGVKEIIEKEGFKGTVRYYGCPAEEELSGKVFMAQKGVFKDLSCAFSWHPFDMNFPFYAGTNANYSVKFRFHGTSAHAAQAPHNGRSALDAVELMNVGANYLREHVKTSMRIHYVITHGGERPNIVPPFAENWYFVRGPKASDIKDALERLIDIAKGAALMTGTKAEYEVLSGTYDFMANIELTKLIEKNMELVGAPKYAKEDYEFAEKVAATMSKEQRISVIKGFGGDASLVEKALHDELGGVNQHNLSSGGSLDIGDISYMVPTAQLSAAAWPLGIPAHTWQSCAASGGGTGFKAMIMAAKVMASTAYDVIVDDTILQSAWNEHKKNTYGKEYKSLMEI
jgi:aminobenzoyl-glutamate utilization protein B